MEVWCLVQDGHGLLAVLAVHLQTDKYTTQPLKRILGTNYFFHHFQMICRLVFSKYSQASLSPLLYRQETPVVGPEKNVEGHQGLALFKFELPIVP